MALQEMTWVGYPGEYPGKQRPRWRSEGQKSLCEVDFGYRTDSYFVQSSRVVWLLWHRYWDETTDKQRRNVVASIPKDGISEHDAAAKLLQMFFGCDSEAGGVPDVTPGGVLSASELRAIVAWTYGRAAEAG